MRLCGLAAAGQGLELATHRRVRRCRRQGGRLEATVGEPTAGCLAWLELTEEASPPAMRWGCVLDASSGASAGTFGCAHVAAILSAWLRHPEDFEDLTAAALDAHEPERAPDVAPPARHSTASQPSLLAEPAGRLRRFLAASGHTPGTSLADELRRLPSGALLAMALRVVGENAGGEELTRERLHAALADPVLLNTLVARLDPSAVQLLWAIVQLGGVLTVDELDAIARRSGRPISTLREQVRALERHALIFRAESGAGTSGSQRWRRLVGWRVPPEIRAGLALALPIEPLPMSRPEGPPLDHLDPGRSHRAGEHIPGKNGLLRVVRANPRRMALALALLARAPYPLGPLVAAARERPATQRHPSHVLAMVAGDLPPQQVAQLARGTGLPIGLIRMVRRLLLWARERDPRHPLLDLSAVPREHRVVALGAGFHLWLGARSPAELVDLDLALDGVHVRYDPTHAAFRLTALADEAVEARRFVTRLVAQARPGAWYSVERLLDLVWTVQPDFLRGRLRPYLSPPWWLESSQGRVLHPSVEDEWRAGEGIYLREMLLGPLHQWGVLDLAEDAAARMRAFRVTNFGAYLLGVTEISGPVASVLDGSAGSSLLPTTGGALALDPLDADQAVLEALAYWTRPTAVVGARLLCAPVPGLAAAMFDQAQSPDALLALLRTAGGASGARVAAALGAQLADWRARYGRASITEGAALLEAADEATLAEALAALPAVAACCHRIDGVPAVLLTPEDAALLGAALKKRGYEI